MSLVLLVGFLAALTAVAIGVAVAVRAMRSAAGPAVQSRLGGTIRSIDPFAVGEPWRIFVRDALGARTRFEAVVAAARSGPLRERLAEIGTRLDHGVEQVWETAQRGHAVGRARRQIDTRRVESRLAEARRAAESDGDAELAARTIASLEDQLAVAGRLDAATERTVTGLRLLQAQLDESVTRAAELAARSAADADLSAVRDDVEHVVVEMEALRQALEETATLDDPSAGQAAQG
ncbi:MAG: hypothetical protein OEY23_04925 [Acidimicrobiia bacterium]|nr:hypothetical protein [Acidimicrobiia bacterium]